ncbi:MAG: hypothetical protein ABR585_12575 [Gemmatimonadaceae bacterium]
MIMAHNLTFGTYPPLTSGITTALVDTRMHHASLEWAAAEYEAYVAEREWSTEGYGDTLPEFAASLESISDYAQAAHAAARDLEEEL